MSNTWDSSRPLPPLLSKRVRIKGLTSAQSEFNGTCGIVLTFAPGAGTYTVCLEGPGGEGTLVEEEGATRALDLKPENLELASAPAAENMDVSDPSAPETLGCVTVGRSYSPPSGSLAMQSRSFDHSQSQPAFRMLGCTQSDGAAAA